MSSINIWLRPSILSILLLLCPCLSTAAPLSHLYKRDLGTGAKAGLGIGIAVAAIIAVGIVIFVVVHVRRSRHIAAINKERAILAGEKNKDGSDKPDTFAPEPQPAAIPRRNKSIKDRMMGPLYRGSMIDLMPVPKARLAGDNPNRASTMSTQSASSPSFLHKPWAGGESSPRPSFSSRRATRMMMMM